MSDMPQTTLTQRRNQISGGAKKLTKSRLDPFGSTSSFAGGQSEGEKTAINGTKLPVSGVDRGAVIKVLIWIVVVVFIGVGAALFVTNMLSTQPKKGPVTAPVSAPVSSPVAQVPDPESDTDGELDPVDNGTGEQPTDSTDGDGVDTGEPTPPAPQTPVTPPAGSVTATQFEVYSSEARSLTAATPGRTLTLSKFRFFDSTSGFNYIFTDNKSTTASLDPDIKVSYEGNDLVVEFNNVKADNVTGNGGSTSRNFTSVSGISGTETSNKNGVSKYVFKSTSKFEHRIIIDQETKEIKIQIKNRG